MFSLEIDSDIWHAAKILKWQLYCRKPVLNMKPKKLNLIHFDRSVTKVQENESCDYFRL